MEAKGTAYWSSQWFVSLETEPVRNRGLKNGLDAHVLLPDLLTKQGPKQELYTLAWLSVLAGPIFMI